MEYAINFPNLGIHFKHVGKAITILGFDITYYGILIGIAILVGILLTVREANRTGQNSEHYFDLAIWGIVFSVIGARLYYVIFNFTIYKDNFLNIFNIRKGGLAIYGGIIAAVITVFVFARVKELAPMKLLDTAVFGLVAGQAIGRWGNFFNREAFGGYTDGLFAMQLPADAVRTADITDKMREHVVRIKEVSFIQVHPTFLYEAIWCLLLLAVLLVYKKHNKFEGELFLIYICGYSLGRIWIEALRTDKLYIPGTPIPISMVLAILCVVFSAFMIRKGWVITRYRKSRANRSIRDTV